MKYCIICGAEENTGNIIKTYLKIDGTYEDVCDLCVAIKIKNNILKTKGE